MASDGALAGSDDGLSPATRAQIAQAAKQLQSLLPAPSGAPSGSAVAAASSSSFEELSEALATLGEEEQATAWGVASHVADEIRGRLLERAQVLA